MSKRFLRESDPLLLAGGGFFNRLWGGLKQAGRGVGDFALSSLGMPNVINNSFVDRSKFLTGFTNTLGTVAPMAAAIIPGAGPLVSAGLSLGANAINNEVNNRAINNNPINQMGYNPYMMGDPYAGRMGGLNIPGFMGGSMGTIPPNMGGAMMGGGQGMGMLSGLLSGLLSGGFQNLFESGGAVGNYQTGGVVDIQAEKGEMILHPTSFLTDVHARRTHKQMDKDGDVDIITDHPMENSYIFSDYLRINKKDAEDFIVSVKRFPYKEGEKGREPEVTTLGELFKGRERSKSPAELARRVSKKIPVTNDDKDIFNIVGDDLNKKNRLRYLSAISILNDYEKDGNETNKMKMGGGVKKYQNGSGVGLTLGNYLNNPGYGVGLGVDSYLANRGSGNSIGLNLNNARQFVQGNPLLNFGTYSFAQNPYTQQRPVNNGNYEYLGNVGRKLIPIGAGINAGTNIAGAIGSYALYNNLARENSGFFQGQSELANQSRDMGALGALSNIGLSLGMQGPEDVPGRFSNTLRSYNPQISTGYAIDAANRSIGQINSLVRNNPNMRGVNIGAAIAANNQSIANAQIQEQQKRFEIGNALDAENQYNRELAANNSNARTKFNNERLSQVGAGINNLFQNEAYRSVNQMALNNAERLYDIQFRQARLNQPLNYLSTLGQTLFNGGAGLASLGISSRYMGRGGRLKRR